MSESQERRLVDEELSSALKGWLGSEAVVEVSRDTPDGRITGWIMHPYFHTVDRSTRQDWLWLGFHEGKGLNDWPGLRTMYGELATQIGMIFTFSPLEYENAFGETPKTA